MIKKIKPVSRVVKIEAEINRIAGEVFYRKRKMFDWEETWVPCVDIHENREEITVEVEIPGVNQKDITIMLHSNRLEISGLKKESPSPGSIRYYRLEREYGKFNRRVYLPCLVIPEKATAILENGILIITIKKYSQEKDKEVVVTIDGPKDTE